MQLQYALEHPAQRGITSCLETNLMIVHGNDERDQTPMIAAPEPAVTGRISVNPAFPIPRNRVGPLGRGRESGLDFFLMGFKGAKLKSRDFHHTYDYYGPVKKLSAPRSPPPPCRVKADEFGCGRRLEGHSH